MKAAVYFGPQDIRCTDIPDPVLRADHEMLVRVLATSICGSDLHLYRGALDPIMEKGKSQTGHELVGEVTQVGDRVGSSGLGDRVSMVLGVLRRLLYVPGRPDGALRDNAKGHLWIWHSIWQSQRHPRGGAC